MVNRILGRGDKLRHGNFYPVWAARFRVAAQAQILILVRRSPGRAGHQNKMLHPRRKIQFSVLRPGHAEQINFSPLSQNVILLTIHARWEKRTKRSDNLKRCLNTVANEPKNTQK